MHKSYYRKASPELPLGVYYFAASYVDEKPQPLHRSNALYLLLMQSGRVHFHTVGGMEILAPGDICIVPPALLRAVHTVSIDTRYIIFSMNPELFPFPPSHFFYQEFLLPVQQGTLRMPQLLRPGVQGYEEVLRPLKRLDIHREGTKTYSMELLTIAMELCSALYPLCENTAAPDVPSQSICDKCVYYIDRHYQQHITLQELAAYVHLHPNYLCALFRTQTGKTVFEQINWVRVHAASRLLRSTHLSVSQIAAQCGFQNTNYFSRTFKQFLGRSPSDYRKNSRSA